MSKYIKRETVLAHLRECEGTPPEIAYTYPIFKAIECFVEGLPAADVAPVVRGQWLINSDGYYPYCSECKAEPKHGEMTRFCHSCGAKMEE